MRNVAATDVSMLMLALNCPSLTSLVLSGAHISDIGLEHIARSVCAPRLAVSEDAKCVAYLLYSGCFTTLI